LVKNTGGQSALDFVGSNPLNESANFRLRPGPIRPSAAERQDLSNLLVTDDRAVTCGA
jgi:hypothetical protein